MARKTSKFATHQTAIIIDRYVFLGLSSALSACFRLRSLVNFVVPPMVPGTIFIRNSGVCTTPTPRKLGVFCAEAQLQALRAG